MLTARFVVWIYSVGIVVLGADAIVAQNYPDKTVRIVVGGTGTATDLTARLAAQELTVSLGQQVIVDNRSSVVIAAETAGKAPPDGYVLLVGGNSFWVGPLLRKTSYDAMRDFTPISILATSPNILVVHPSVPAKSVRELISLGKARSGALNYSAVPAGASHLGMELFKSMADVNIVRIPYKSAGAALNDLIAGHVQVMIVAAGSVAPHLKTGRLRALAVTAAQPSAEYPGLSTVSASGLPGFESASIYGMFAPAGTPAPIVNRLNQDVVRALSRADVKEKLLSTGVSGEGSTPARLAATLKSELALLGKVIKDLGIQE